MYTEQEKYDALSTVLTSKTFSKSTTANVLLKLLVEASIKEQELTAADIGREMFGHHYQHEKSEANVRVNIYHLRKKLKKYYEEEGADSAIVITIEVGQYQVSFSTRKTDSSISSKRLLPWSIVVILLVSLAAVFFLSRRPQDRIWSDLFENDKPSTLYLSPIYGFWGPSMVGQGAFHRNVKINSDEDFNALMDSLPELKKRFRAETSNYVTFEDAATIKNFSGLFTLNGEEFTVRKSDDFTVSALKEQNIIYLSPMRYKSTFSSVFDELSSNCEFLEERDEHLDLLYKSPLQSKDSVIRLISDARNYECAIAAKLKGANDTWHYMFFADHGIGLTAMSEFFTNQDSIARFSDRYLQEKQEFVAVYYVSGKDRTNLDMELLFIDVE